MFWPGQEPLGPSGYSMGWVLLPPTSREEDPENPGGEAASWVVLCPSQPLTLLPAPSGRTWEGHGKQPEATDHVGRQWQPPFRGGDRAARIRGHRELCLCVIRQPDIPDWRWHWGDCQKLCGRGDVIWEIVFLPADTFGLAVKNVCCPQGSF